MPGAVFLVVGLYSILSLNQGSITLSKLLTTYLTTGAETVPSYIYLFTFFIFLTLFISWLGKKFKKPAVQLINLTLTYGFFIPFWFSKFVVNSKIEFLPLFFIFAFLFYLLFYSLLAFTSDKEDLVPRWIQLVVTGLNLFILIGTTSFVLIRYFAVAYSALFILALVIFQFTGLYLMKKSHSTAWSFPHHLAIMGLIALILPLLIQQNRPIFITALLSMLLLGYANKLKEQAALWLSLVALISMILFYLFSWISFCLPTLFEENTLPDRALIGYGLLMGGLVTGALTFTTWQLQTSDLHFSKQWIRKRKYDRFVRFFLHISIFLTLGWLVFTVTSLVAGSMKYNPVAWFIAGALFFTGAIRYYSGRSSSFKKPVLYLALAFVLHYPLLVQWNMSDYRTTLMLMHEQNGFVLFLHYLALLLLLISGGMISKRLKRHYQRNDYVKYAVELVTVLFLLYLGCSEYDNLSVILGTFHDVPEMQSIVGPDPLSQNVYLPYSVVIWVIAVATFIQSIVHKNLFLRNLAIVLYCGIVVKLFAFDIIRLGTGARSIVLVVLGMFLIGFALVYPRLLRGEQLFPEFERSQSGRNKKRVSSRAK